MLIPGTVAAAALAVVLVHSDSWAFVAFAFLCNSLLLVCMGLVFNSLTGRPYPHKNAAELLPLFSESGHHHLPIIDKTTGWSAY